MSPGSTVTISLTTEELLVGAGATYDTHGTLSTPDLDPSTLLQTATYGEVPRDTSLTLNSIETPTTVTPGQKVSYTLYIYTSGEYAPAGNVTIAIRVPATFTPDDLSASCRLELPLVLCASPEIDGSAGFGFDGHFTSAASGPEVFDATSRHRQPQRRPATIHSHRNRHPTIDAAQATSSTVARWWWSRRAHQ